MPRHPLGKDPSSYPSNARPDANRPAFRPASGHPSTSSAAAANAGLIHPAELKAFSRRDDALDEAEWLESKFQRSGAPEPAEGELTVVIDYCYNSGPDQLTTRHNPKEFHEEAELVRQYFLNYHTGATVFVVSSDFRFAKERRGVRLGAFEIDARLRIDGVLQTHSIWSKLHTGRWPPWPQWQDKVRNLIPVFHFCLRPAALRSDGSRKFLPMARVRAYTRMHPRHTSSRLSPLKPLTLLSPLARRSKSSITTVQSSSPTSHYPPALPSHVRAASPPTTDQAPRHLVLLSACSAGPIPYECRNTRTRSTSQRRRR